MRAFLGILLGALSMMVWDEAHKPVPIVRTVRVTSTPKPYDIIRYTPPCKDSHAVVIGRSFAWVCKNSGDAYSLRVEQ